MPFALTEDQRTLRKHVFELGRNVFFPRAAEWDERAEYPWANHKVLQEQQLFAVIMPPEYGGLGLTLVDFAVVLEALAASSTCGATLGAVETHSLGAQPILIGGTDEQKKRFLPQLANADAICAFSLTEPGAGSDAASITTKAVRDGDEYVINGHKCFCTLGNVASYVTVFAKTQMDAGARGISAFVVDTSTPGFNIGRVEKKMGLKGSPTVELFLEDVRVPAANRLGEEGTGFRIAMENMIKGRLAIAADCVGIMEFSINYAINYAKERTQFGHPIGDLQAIQFMLADMAVKHETAKYVTYGAADAADRKELPRAEITKLTAVSKCYATDVRQQVVSDAIQILGGYGYMKDHPLERIYRDSKIYQIFDGTNQIQRMVIARSMLG